MDSENAKRELSEVPSKDLEQLEQPEHPGPHTRRTISVRLTAPSRRGSASVAQPAASVGPAHSVGPARSVRSAHPVRPKPSVRPGHLLRSTTPVHHEPRERPAPSRTPTERRETTPSVPPVSESAEEKAAIQKRAEGRAKVPQKFRDSFKHFFFSSTGVLKILRMVSR
ncbi:PREDICTED: pre-mRNA-splicing factor cwc22-like [Galeopterus variegatus]|uniref:Pre-mRNA-splicing factor cwc22-like n=1 Tax=Galeopterus variegatus TaxID=482537 RepID=A0ABM0QVH0_GALVR|nr:PREDICTED: pre-mRNA-splicing factor cwc22-like [Galeopterus variegatus]